MMLTKSVSDIRNYLCCVLISKVASYRLKECVCLTSFFIIYVYILIYIYMYLVKRLILSENLLLPGRLWFNENSLGDAKEICPTIKIDYVNVFLKNKNHAKNMTM